MICYLPVIDLPPELIEANSSLSVDYDAVPTSRRRRDTATEYVGGKTLLGRLWNFVRTGSWSANTSPRRLSRQKRAPVAYVSNMNVSMSLYLGFVMDKFPSLKNISKTKPKLRLELIPYNFQCDQTPVTFDPTVNPLLKIKVIFDLIFSLCKEASHWPYLILSFISRQSRRPTTMHRLWLAFRPTNVTTMSYKSRAIARRTARLVISADCGVQRPLIRAMGFPYCAAPPSVIAKTTSNCKLLVIKCNWRYINVETFNL